MTKGRRTVTLEDKDATGPSGETAGALTKIKEETP